MSKINPLRDEGVLWTWSCRLPASDKLGLRGRARGVRMNEWGFQIGSFPIGFSVVRRRRRASTIGFVGKTGFGLKLIFLPSQDIQFCWRHNIYNFGFNRYKSLHTIYVQTLSKQYNDILIKANALSESGLGEGKSGLNRHPTNNTSLWSLRP